MVIEVIPMGSPLSGIFIKPQRKWGQLPGVDYTYRLFPFPRVQTRMKTLTEYGYGYCTQERVLLLLFLLSLLPHISVGLVLRLPIDSWPRQR